MGKDFIVLLCGKSGSGKTAVSSALTDELGWKAVQSYTDRPMRFPDEKGHVFVTGSRFDMIPDKEMVAYTEFAGHRYCATREQVNKSDIYVIDLKGIEEFKTRYKGNKKVVVIYLAANDDLLVSRMLKRGDSFTEAKNRVSHDKVAFKGAKKVADKTIFVSPDKTIRDIVDEITTFLSGGGYGIP